MNMLQGTLEVGEKKFAIINTTNYNDDNKWAIIVTDLKGLSQEGLDEDEVWNANILEIGQHLELCYGSAAQVVRLG